MKSSKDSRRRRSDAIQRELRSLRDEERDAGSFSMRDEGSTVERKQQQRQWSRRENFEVRRTVEDIGSQTSSHEGRRRSSTDYAPAVGAATDDSYGEDDERAPFGGSSMMSTSTRLALAERALAEVTMQRDTALEELESSRRENAKLREELERARSYKALYAAAHEEHKGMKASLAASTQICMGQQKLIQMLQASSSASALGTEELLVSPLGGPTPPPLSPPPARRRSGALERGEEVKAEALAAAAIALAQGKRRGVEEEYIGDLESVETDPQARKSSGGADDSGDAAASAATALGAESLHESRAWSPALFSEPDTPPASARHAFARRAVAVASETSAREGLTAADLERGQRAAGGGTTDRTGGGDRGGNRAGRRRMNSLDDDLISHSSLRREYDETFLNQPLRGELRRGEQQGQYHWAFAGGDESGFEGEGGDLGADASDLAATQGRARLRGHGRERTRTKSGSLSSVSTVASATKSAKGLGKEEQRPRRSKSERSSGRDTTASITTTTVCNTARGARVSSPRTSARQARVSQRLSSGTPSSFASSGAAASTGTGTGAGAAGDPREPLSRRSSTGSSVRPSTRKR